jgi:hypothetical protein
MNGESIPCQYLCLGAIRQYKFKMQQKKVKGFRKPLVKELKEHHGFGIFFGNRGFGKVREFSLSTMPTYPLACVPLQN